MQAHPRLSQQVVHHHDAPMQDLMDAKELGHTISSLYPGIKRLFDDVAIPNMTGPYVLEKSFMSFVSPIVEKYAYKHTLLQAFGAVHKLEHISGRSALPGLTLQGLIAALCRVADAVFQGPVWAHFPTASMRLRLLLSLCDPAQKYFRNTSLTNAPQYKDFPGWMLSGSTMSAVAPAPATPDTRSPALRQSRSSRASDRGPHIRSHHTAEETLSHTTEVPLATIVFSPTHGTAQSADQSQAVNSARVIPERRVRATKSLQERREDDELLKTTLSHAKAIEESTSRRESTTTPLRMSWENKRAEVDELLQRLRGDDVGSLRADESLRRSSLSDRIAVSSASNEYTTTTPATSIRDTPLVPTLSATTQPPERMSTTLRRLSVASSGALTGRRASSPAEIVISALCSQTSVHTAPEAPAAETLKQEASPMMLPEWSITAHVLEMAHRLDASVAEEVLRHLFNRYCLYGDRDKYTYTMLHSSESNVNLRMNANQFSKFCLDARLSGRGGHGGGFINRADVDVEFRAAVARMSGTGTQPSSIRLWKQNSYTFREVTRSMLTLGLSYAAFASALMQLARRRYCSPSSLVENNSGFPKTILLEKVAARIAAECAWVVEWNALAETAEQITVDAASITPQLALRLVLLLHVAPLAVTMGILQNQWDMLGVSDGEVANNTESAEFTEVTHINGAVQHVEASIPADESAPAATASTIQQNDDSASTPRQPYPFNAGPFRVPEATAPTIARQQQEQIKEAEEEIEELCHGIRTAISMVEDCLEDVKSQLPQAMEMPLEQVVAKDVRLLHPELIPVHLPTPAVVVPTNQPSPPGIESVTAATAVIQSRTHHIDGKRPPSTGKRSTYGSPVTHIQRNIAAVTSQPPSTDNINTNANNNSNSRSTSSPRLRERSRRLEFSQSELLPRTRSLSRSRNAKAAAVAAGVTQADGPVINSARQALAFHQLLAQVAQTVTHHDVAPHHEHGVGAAVSEDDDHNMMYDAPQALQEVSPPNKNNQNLTPEALAGSRHVNWSDSTTSALRLGSAPDTASAVDRTVDNGDSWGVLSDGQRSVVPAVSQERHSNPLFTPPPAAKFGPMPTTDRAQREWQRRFAENSSEASVAGSPIARLGDNAQASFESADGNWLDNINGTSVQHDSPGVTPSSRMHLPPTSLFVPRQTAQADEHTPVAEDAVAETGVSRALGQPVHLVVRPEGVEIFQGHELAAQDALTNSKAAPAAQKMATKVRFHRSGSFDIESLPQSAVETEVPAVSYPLLAQTGAEDDVLPSSRRLSSSSQLHASSQPMRANVEHKPFTPGLAQAARVTVMESGSDSAANTAPRRRLRSPHKIQGPASFTAAPSTLQAPQQLMETVSTTQHAVHQGAVADDDAGVPLPGSPSMDAQTSTLPLSPASPTDSDAETEADTNTVDVILQAGHPPPAASSVAGMHYTATAHTLVGRLIPSQAPTRTPRASPVMIAMPPVLSPGGRAAALAAKRRQHAEDEDVQHPPSASQRTINTLRRDIRPTKQLTERKAIITPRDL